MASTAVTLPYIFVSCTNSSAAVFAMHLNPHYAARDQGIPGAPAFRTPALTANATGVPKPKKIGLV